MAFTVKKTFRGVQASKGALKVDFENGTATISVGNQSVFLTGDEMVRLEALFFKLAVPNDRNIRVAVEDDLRRINPPKTPIFEEGTVAKRLAENKNNTKVDSVIAEQCEWVMEDPIEQSLLEDTVELPVGDLNE